MTEFIVVIPARYQSSRLPGKPLRLIAGKPMIQHVVERALLSDATAVLVATDDTRIAESVKSFGGSVCMTQAHHQSGTERLAEVADLQKWGDQQIVVNLQGDEPDMPPALINECADLLAQSSASIATLASPLQNLEDFRNPNVVKVICNAHGEAMYFSRASIPFAREMDQTDRARSLALHHHGIYAYRCGALRTFVRAPAADLEEVEQLEQLRALSMGMRIAVGRPSTRPGAGVDTEADLDRVEATMKKEGG